MATVSANGKYLKLGVNVWYDKNADNFHITTNDPEFKPSGLHITMKKGTVSDEAMRAVFERLGCFDAINAVEPEPEPKQDITADYFEHLLKDLKGWRLEDDKDYATRVIHVATDTTVAYWKRKNRRFEPKLVWEDIKDGGYLVQRRSGGMAQRGYGIWMPVDFLDDMCKALELLEKATEKAKAE